MSKGIQFTKRFWLIYFLAWIPYALTYVAIFLTQSSSGFVTVGLAALRNIVPAAILGIGVIWLCNRFDWSFLRKPWFFPIHTFLAFAYTFAWTAVLFLLLTIDLSLEKGVWTPVLFIGNALQWQLFTGIMLYATIASIVYVLQVVQNLREEERRAARAETLYAQNALAALQVQLNPHFLFNTLHTLMALVRYDPQKAENALEKLAEMLRYSLKDKRKSKNYLVRLEDELEFVENYLGLEKLRLGKRLKVDKNIEEETLDCLVPAFTIQPLVENSIKHGIAPKNISATIFISAKKEDGNLKIEVKDDGVGSQNGSFENSVGLGINLVREQLQIQYGERSVFEVYTKPHMGFKTTIRIPANFVDKQIEEKGIDFEYSNADS